MAFNKATLWFFVFLLIYFCCIFLLLSLFRLYYYYYRLLMRALLSLIYIHTSYFCLTANKRLLLGIYYYIICVLLSYIPKTSIQLVARRVRKMSTQIIKLLRKFDINKLASSKHNFFQNTTKPNTLICSLTLVKINRNNDDNTHNFG